MCTIIIVWVWCAIFDAFGCGVQFSNAKSAIFRKWAEFAHKRTRLDAANNYEGTASSIIGKSFPSS